eukprot:1957768-Prorocentrum_lima.AAC.1
MPATASSKTIKKTARTSMPKCPANWRAIGSRGQHHSNAIAPALGLPGAAVNPPTPLPGSILIISTSMN